MYSSDDDRWEAEELWGRLDTQLLNSEELLASMNSSGDSRSRWKIFFSLPGGIDMYLNKLGGEQRFFPHDGILNKPFTVHVKGNYILAEW